MAETLCFDYQRQYIVKTSRAYSTLTDLINPDDGRVVSNFIVQALSNKPIAIYGKGEQTRSFCYVSQ